MDVFAPVIDYAAGLFKRGMEGMEHAAPVRVGGWSVDKPEAVFVIEDPLSVTYSNPATSMTSMGGRARGLYRVEFEVHAQIWAVRSDVWEASKLVLSWFEAFVREQARDKTLGGLAQNSVPIITNSMSEATNQKSRYISALEGGLRVTCDVNPCE